MPDVSVSLSDSEVVLGSNTCDSSEVEIRDVTVDDTDVEEAVELMGSWTENEARVE